jgi:hypothetical protein
VLKTRISVEYRGNGKDTPLTGMCPKLSWTAQAYWERFAGRAIFNLAIKPVFEFVRPSTGEARLMQTKIYFSGIETSTQVQVYSEVAI